MKFAVSLSHIHSNNNPKPSLFNNDIYMVDIITMWNFKVLLTEVSTPDMLLQIENSRESD